MVYKPKYKRKVKFKMPQSKTNIQKPKQRRLKGKGDYTDQDRKQLNHIKSTLDQLDKRVPKLSNVGRGIGNIFGMGELGDKAGSALSSLFGMGDYHVKTNSLMKLNDLQHNEVPVFDRNGRRGVRITEREYLGDLSSASTLVNGASAFHNTVYKLNPSSRATFPWLSTIAEQFEQWEPHGIVFEFVSTSSEYNGSSQALGTVIMATDYDVYDTPASNKIIMENMDYANSTKPSLTAMHGIECDPSERPNRILYCGDNSSGDARFSDLGNFQLATQGCSTANATLGEVWVSYDITFYKKQISSSYVSNSMRVYSNGPTVLPTVTSVLGLSVVAPDSSPNFTLVPLIGTGVRIYFPPAQASGKYQMLWTCSSSTASSSVSTTSFTLATVTSSKSYFNSGGAIVVAYLWNITIDGPGASVLFPLSNTNTSDVVLTITPVV